MILLDLFSGIGGFHFGLELANHTFDKVYFSDIDDYANKDYSKRYPKAISLGDIKKIDPKQLLEENKGSQWFITGGFPCQDISIAGKKKGITGERSSLFHEIIRIASVLRPKLMLLENVRNLLSGENGNWMRTVLGGIASIGYDAEWEVIPASALGAWHRRARVWIIAYPCSK